MTTTIFERIIAALEPFAKFYKSEKHDFSPANEGMIVATFLDQNTKEPLAELLMSDFKRAYETLSEYKTKYAENSAERDYGWCCPKCKIWFATDQSNHPDCPKCLEKCTAMSEDDIGSFRFLGYKASNNRYKIATVGSNYYDKHGRCGKCGDRLTGMTTTCIPGCLKLPPAPETE